MKHNILFNSTTILARCPISIHIIIYELRELAKQTNVFGEQRFGVGTSIVAAVNQFDN